MVSLKKSKNLQIAISTQNTDSVGHRSIVDMPRDPGSQPGGGNNL